MMDYVVYGLITPNGGHVFYVGITNDLSRRMMNHWNDRNQKASKSKRCEIKRIKESNRIMGVVILADKMTLEQAAKTEVLMIQYYGRMDLNRGPLTNRTDGGVGGKTKSSFKKGHVPSEKSRLALSAKLKGQPSHRKGKTGCYSAETLKKKSDSLKGRTQSKAWVEKRIPKRRMYLYKDGVLVCKFKSRQDLALILNRSINSVRNNGTIKINNLKYKLSYDALL
jgi:predicted GIY-YIG superfamily endonuclease